MRWPADKVTIKQAYERDGFVILRSFLSDDELSALHAAVHEYIEQRVPMLPPMDVFCAEKGNHRTITMLSRMNHHAPYFRDMLAGPRFRELAEDVWGSSAVTRDIAMFDKPPQSAHATPPHQDGYYFHLTPCEAMTMWLALDPVDEENGCVRYVRGSHRRGMRPHGRTEVLGFSQGVLDYSDADRTAEIAACVDPGDLIVHDALTVHRADANRSLTRHRRAIGIVYFSGRAEVDHAASRAYQAKLQQEWKVAGKI